MSCFFCSRVRLDALLHPPTLGDGNLSNSLDPLAASRAERIAQMVGNLLPRIRPLSGHLSEDELLEAAAYMAVYRVADQEETTAKI
jgi:hypothetical protein